MPGVDPVPDLGIPVILRAGTSLAQSLPAEAHTVKIDNPTLQWLHLPDVADGYVPPAQIGYIVNLPGVLQARAEWAAPPGIAQPAAILGQQAVLRFYSGQLPPNAGSSIGINVSVSGEISGADLRITGLSGANAVLSRYVGTTTGGPPVAGTFQVGDWVLDLAGPVFWVCEAPGTPGTWSRADGWFGLGSAIQGVPSISSPFKRQAGTVVLATNAAGDASFNFPNAFPNGVQDCVVGLGDVAGPATSVAINAGGVTLAVVNVRGFNGAAVAANTQIRVNWEAWGW